VSLADLDPCEVSAVGHRVVHGGARFREPVVINRAVEEEIRALEAIAPLHNAPALAHFTEARRRLPDVPHVAVFDTAFHGTLPDEAAAYPVPRRWREEWGIRRYGFHGLSVQWAAERAAELLGGNPGELRLVVCHLGGGCSVTAVAGGRSVDTTMGFTPLEGLPMTTRSGSVDPGVLIYLLRQRHLSIEELDRALNFDSGLKGLSCTSGDIREVERAATADADARLALQVYTHRIAGAVAAMTASLSGLDVLVFTAGVGERSATVRQDVCARLRFLGVDLDCAANSSAVQDADIAAVGSPVRVLVVAAREDLVIAREARRVLG
jgi:acetate kinase